MSANRIDLSYASEDQLSLFHALEQDEETAPYILPTTLEQHRQAFAREEIIYLSIQNGATLAGYFILALDSDGSSVELRRIVVGDKGRGTGQAAMRALETWCLENLRRRRIWLDVFDFNSRGRHVYSSLGYRFFEQRDFEGKALLFFEKDLEMA